MLLALIYIVDRDQCSMGQFWIEAWNFRHATDHAAVLLAQQQGDEDAVFALQTGLKTRAGNIIQRVSHRMLLPSPCCCFADKSNILVLAKLYHVQTYF